MNSPISKTAYSATWPGTLTSSRATPPRLAPPSPRTNQLTNRLTLRRASSCDISIVDELLASTLIGHCPEQSRTRHEQCKLDTH
jgi:hypothetical protein